MDQGIGNWTTLHAQRNPDRVAFMEANTDRQYTFGEVEQRTNALAHALQAQGVRKGDRVALMALNSPHFLEVTIAVAKLGAILVPINFRLTAPEVRYILDDAAPCVLFASTQILETARKAADGSLVRKVVEIAAAAKRAAGEGGE